MEKIITSSILGLLLVFSFLYRALTSPELRLYVLFNSLIAPCFHFCPIVSRSFPIPLLTLSRAPATTDTFTIDLDSFISHKSFMSRQFFRVFDHFVIPMESDIYGQERFFAVFCARADTVLQSMQPNFENVILEKKLYIYGVVLKKFLM